MRETVRGFAIAIYAHRLPNLLLRRCRCTSDPLGTAIVCTFDAADYVSAVSLLWRRIAAPRNHRGRGGPIEWTELEWCVLSRA